MLLWANASVSSSETPTKSKRNADLSSRVGQTGVCRSTGLSSHLSDFCWLVSSLPDSHLLTDPFSWLQHSLDCSLQPTVLFCSLLLIASATFLPSSSSDLVWDHSRKPIVWVSCQSRRRDCLTGTHIHRNGCYISCHTSRFIEISQNTEKSPGYLLRWVRIRRIVLKIWWDLLSFRLREKLSTNACEKNSHEVNRES